MKKMNALVSLIMLSSVEAMPSYRTRIPNGDKVPCPEGAEGCTGTADEVCNGLGHASCEGGFKNKALNPFGADFMAESFKWTVTLCEKDSDGDGITNGEELGDPCCEWEVNDVASDYMQTFVPTHPGMDSDNQTNYMAPTCGESTAPTKATKIAGWNPNEERKNVSFTIKGYKLPKRRTTYVDFVFNFDDETQGIFHIVYGEAIVDQPTHLHHFVVTGCSQKIEKKKVGMPLPKVPSYCNLQLGGFSGWAPGTMMWENPVTAGVAIGKDTGIVAISVNVHYTDANTVKGDVIAKDGVLIHYTPTLRKQTIYSTPVLNLGTGPMLIAPNLDRHFVTRRCKVVEGCMDNEKDLKAWMGKTCKEMVDAGECKKDSKVRTYFCPKSCGCTKNLPMDVTASYYHAHLLGREMYFTLEKKDNLGTLIDLNSQPVWFYDDQAIFHGLDNRNITLEEGDVLQTTCVYNSTGLDVPTQFSIETIDEMCINTLFSLHKTGVEIPEWGPFACEGDIWTGDLKLGEDGKELNKLHPQTKSKDIYKANILAHAEREMGGNDECPLGFMLGCIDRSIDIPAMDLMDAANGAKWCDVYRSAAQCFAICKGETSAFFMANCQTLNCDICPVDTATATRRVITGDPLADKSSAPLGLPSLTVWGTLLFTVAFVFRV